jgi:hypothetical protein
MVYRFRFTSDKYPKFSMDVEVKDSQTFYTFHEFIQDELEYDNSHLATFHVCTHNWEDKQEIVLLKKKKDQEVLLMDKTLIKSFIKDAHQKFKYCYDLINNRCFKVELMETKSETPDMYYPVCTAFAGDVPPQFGTGKEDSLFDDHDDDDDTPVKSKKPVLDDFDDDIIAEPFNSDIDIHFENDDMEEEEEEEKFDDDEEDGADEDDD